MLLTTIKAVLDNVRRRIDGTMGPNFFESIDHSFLYPATEKTDGLTALDRGKSNINDQEYLWSLIALQRIAGGNHVQP